MSRRKKQVAGLYSRLNMNTQEYEQRSNRKLRRSNIARSRKVNAAKRTEYRLNLLQRSVKASRVYYE